MLSGDEPKAHFIRPESYQVTWWPGDHPESDIQSDSTSGNCSSIVAVVSRIQVSLSYDILF